MFLYLHSLMLCLQMGLTTGRSVRMPRSRAYQVCSKIVLNNIVCKYPFNVCDRVAKLKACHKNASPQSFEWHVCDCIGSSIMRLVYFVQSHTNCFRTNPVLCSTGVAGGVPCNPAHVRADARSLRGCSDPGWGILLAPGYGVTPDNVFG